MRLLHIYCNEIKDRICYNDQQDGYRESRRELCYNKVFKKCLAVICTEATGRDVWINLHKAILKTCQVTVAMGSEKTGSTALHAVRYSPALSSAKS